MSKKALKVPGKGAPFRVPPTGFPWRDMLRLQSQWFIHSFISVGVPKRWKTYNHHPRSPTWTEGLHTRGEAWFHKGIIYDTAVTTPALSSLQHDTFHLDLGRPELRCPACVVVTLNRVYPPHLLPPST